MYRPSNIYYQGDKLKHPKEVLEKLEQKYENGDISEEVYNDLKESLMKDIEIAENPPSSDAGSDHDEEDFDEDDYVVVSDEEWYRDYSERAKETQDVLIGGFDDLAENLEPLFTMTQEGIFVPDSEEKRASGKGFPYEGKNETGTAWRKEEIPVL